MPTLLDSTTLVTASATSVTSGTFATNSGDLIVVKYVQEDNNSSITPSGGSLTYTSRAVVSIASNCRVQIWTAVATGGNMAVTVSKGGSGRRMSIVVERYSDWALAATPAIVQTSGTGAPLGTVVSTGTNSIVTWVSGDWAAVNGSGRAWRSSATEEGYDFQSGIYTAYYARQAAASAGNQDCGLTAPTGQTWTIAGLEIQHAGATNATPTPSTVSRAVTIDAPVVTTSGNATPTPATVSRAVAIGAPTVTTGGAGPAEFVAVSSSGADTQATGQTTAKPTGTVSGDLVLLQLVRWNTTNSFAAITPPTGAVQVGSTVAVGPSGNGNFIQTTIWAVVAGAESSYAFTWGATSLWSHCDAQAWHSADTSSLATLVSNTANGTSTTIPSTSATAATGDGAAHFVNTMDGAGSKTPPTGFTEALDETPAGSSYIENLSAGTVTASGGTVTPSQILIAFLVIVPAGGGSSPVDATPTPLTVSRTVTVDAPSVQIAGNVTVAPSVVSRTVAVAVPSITATALATPATVSRTVTIDSMAGAISETVEVAVVARAIVIPAPTVQTAGNASPGPTTVSRAVAIATPTITGSSQPAPATVSRLVSIPAPSVQVGSSATVAASMVPGAAAVASPTIGITANVTPATVARSVVIPAITFTKTALATPATVARQVAVPAPSLQTGSGTVVAAPTVNVSATVGIPVFHLDTLVNAQTVLSNVAIGVVVVNTGGSATTSFYLWNGTTTEPLELEGIWNGTSVDPVSFDEVL